VARPELPIGTWGKIRTETLGPNRFCARARFRDYDGKTRDVEATGPTAPAAIRALNVKLRDRTTPNDDEITRDTRVDLLADLWLDQMAAEARVLPQTLNTYNSSLRFRIRPALGSLRIREASVGRLDRFLRDIAKDHPSAAKGAKVVLGQMFSLAVRHGAISHQPRPGHRTAPQSPEERRRVDRRASPSGPYGDPGLAATDARQVGASAYRRLGRHCRPHARHRGANRRDPRSAVG
jgi:hypothetical protein